MQTKKLIELLQKEDPSGEKEVVMNDGSDIYFLESKSGYWDGRYTTLIIDPDKESKCYSIIGAKYRSDGSKICIRSMNWEDVLDEDSDAIIEVKDEFVNKRMQEEVDRYRVDVKRREEEFEKEWFNETYPTILEKIKEGWKIIQPIKYNIGRLNVMWYIKDINKFKEKDKQDCYISNDNQIHLNNGTCKIIINSGKFVYIENNNFLEWRLKYED